MKLFSKTVGTELDVDVMEKMQDGVVLTVIKHASLMDIIYNQLELAKDPECIQYEAIRPNAPFPVYKCVIWDKEKGRCAVGIGSGNPATLTAGIAADYADESASNRAFDRAAITYLQFGGRQLSEEEVGIFIPTDLISAVEPQDNAEDEQMIQEPVPSIKQAPITQTTENGGIDTAMNPPVVDESTDEVSTSVPETPPSPASVDTHDVEVAGAKIITFGKYSKNPKTVAEICVEDIPFVKQVAKIKNPSENIRADVEALSAYAAAKGIV